MSNNPLEGSVAFDKSKPLQIHAIALSTVATKKAITENAFGDEIYWLLHNDFWLAVRAVSDSDNRSIEAIREYEAVVQKLHEMVDVIPMRFGTVTPQSQIPTLIDQQHDQLKRTFKRVAGCSELLLRWKIPEEKRISESDSKEPIIAEGQHQTGRAYLREKYRAAIQNKRFDYLVSEAKSKVDSILGDSIAGTIAKIMNVILPSQDDSTTSTQPIIAIDLLVKKDRFDQVHDIAKNIELFGSRPVLVRGPLPIYSFAEQQL